MVHKKGRDNDPLNGMWANGYIPNYSFPLFEITEEKGNKYGNDPNKWSQVPA